MAKNLVNRCELVITQTNDVSELISVMDKINISKFIRRTKFLDGHSDVIKTIKVAQLSLKNRQNKAAR